MHRDAITVDIGENQITFETGKIARQANGAVLIRCGETVVFTSACADHSAPSTGDFLPLRVDYQELFSSAGKTSSGFVKRQGRPSEREILVSRLIDRPLRPMFEEGYYNDVQVLSYVWSYDGVVAPEPLAICGASASLVLSDIPLIKPIAAVRVGFVNNQFIVNPTVQQQGNSKLDLLLAGTEDGILMIEGFCDFLTEEQIVEAIELGHSAIKKICHALLEWQQRRGREKNRSTLRSLPTDVVSAVESLAKADIEQALRIPEKQKREDRQAEIHQQIVSSLFPADQEPRFAMHDVLSALKQTSAKAMREMILSENVRSDGRNCRQIRHIDIEQHFLPRAHGSALFTRGETQAVAVCTLGGESMAQRFENLEEEGVQRFYLHYFFPPFSVGEVGRVGAPGRREIGHGKLAERALLAILPPRDKFAYTLRIESSITESNGSSSMATVCGGCLAMMDAGVPISRPVAGIAMGLILEGERYAVLSDILGIEDALGDMDFKVTGDKTGVTAFQMDIKIEGITPAIMREALAQAKEGRIHILEKMLEVCPRYREKMSEHAPRIETIQIKPSMIAKLIGPGGKQIRAIKEETGAEIDIEDDGTVSISASSFESIELTKELIVGITAEVEIGRIYKGKVTAVMPFGVFAEILPGKEGLCHISEYDNFRIESMNDHAKVGDEHHFKVLDINDRHQIKLSRKAALSAAPSA